MSVNQGNSNSQPMADDDLPEWLREIRGTPPPPEPETTTPAPEPDPVVAEDESLPSWLKEVQEEEASPTEAPTELPAEEMPASAAAESDDSGDDWLKILSGEGIEPETLAEERPEGAENMSLRDWIAATSPESPVSSPEASSSSSFESEPPQTSEVEPATADSGAGADDWLKILSDEGIEIESLSEERPEGAENMSLRDWIAATSSESPLAQSSGTSSPGDEFTQEPEPALDVEAATTPEDDEPVVEDELPDWLRADRPVEAEAESLSWLTEPPLAEAEVSSEEMEPAEMLADDGLVVEDELPDWLRAEQPVEAEAESLSWLTDESTHDEGEAEPPLAEAEVSSEEMEPAEMLADDGLVVEDELPDWLRAEQPVEAEAMSLSWLTDESTHDEGEAEPPLAEAEVSSEEMEPAEMLADDGLVVEDELPDWLRAEQPVEAEVESLSWLTEEPVHDGVTAEAEVADVDLESEELSDWLQEAAPDTVDMTSDEGELPPIKVAGEGELAGIASELGDDGIVDIDGLPDWLRDEQDQIDEGIDEIGEDVPAWLAEPPDLDAGEVSEVDLLPAEADLPDWLRETEEDEVITAVEGDDRATEWLDTAVAEEDLLDEPALEMSEMTADSSKVPPWLEKLRSDEETGVADVEAVSGEEEQLLEVEALSRPPEQAPEVVPSSEAQPVPEIAEGAPTGESTAAKLSVAKATLEAGDLEEALEIYRDLINASQAADKIVGVLTQNLERYGNQSIIYEVLGDAHARAGELNKALESYRLALEKL